MVKRKYWLFKSEPDAFSFEDLCLEREATAHWDGVRNYQARNLLRDQIQEGDGVLFYHSSCKIPHVAGIAVVTKAGYPDPTQFSRRSKYYDPKSSKDDPRWFVVDVQADSRFDTEVTLSEMREMKALANMTLLKKGMRLSVQPVTSAEWRAIVKRGRAVPI